MALPVGGQGRFMLERLVQGTLCGLDDSRVQFCALEELCLADLEAVPYAVEQTD